MNFFLQVALLVLLISSVSTFPSIRYVKSSSSINCPGRPCLTLDLYTQQAATYFTTGSTFVFLAGNHSGFGVLNLTSVSGITLKSNASSCILCHNGFKILCSNVSHVIITGLTFLYSGESTYSVLEILNSWSVFIANSTFLGSGNLSLPLTRAVACTQSTLVIASCYFRENTGDNGGAIHVSGSNVTLISNVFTRNTANVSGGAIFAFKYASLLLTDNSFLLNSAVYNGGAMNCKDCSVTMTGYNTFEHNSVNIERASGGAINISKGRLITTGTAIFAHNSASHGGGISLFNSSASLNGGLLVFRNNSAIFGGALFADSKVKTKPLAIYLGAQHLYFVDNKAKDSGGAIHVKYSNLTLGDSMMNNFQFTNNSGVKAGGAIFSRYCNVQLMGNSYYTNNYLITDKGNSQGGAIRILNGNFTLIGYAIFSGNRAFWGGAIQFLNSSAFFEETTTVFKDNSADIGGAIHCEKSEMRFHTEQILFSCNVANRWGGAVAIINGMPITISGNFIHNVANECGGGIFVQRTVNITFSNINITNNTGCGVCVFNSKTSFQDTVSLRDNTGEFGGGLHAENSMVSFTNHTTIIGNQAIFGGGIYSVYGRVQFSGSSLFTRNSAEKDGGAIFALGSTGIMLNKTANFTFNSAKNGGAVYLKSSATVTLTAHTGLTTAHNRAAEYGGTVYYEDNVMPSQCNFIAARLRYEKEATLLPYCFIRLTEMITKSITVSSFDDLAGKGGHFLYGGLLDRCRIHVPNSNDIVTKLEIRKFIQFHAAGNASQIITSQPYQLCFCTSDEEYDCLNARSITVHRGQKFPVALVAIDQMGTLISTAVTAKTKATTSWVFMNQRTQIIDQHCSNTEYSLYSLQDSEELTLYPDGPCRDVGLARAVINVTFHPCPIGFTQSGGECVCEKRLKRYHADCDIDTETITRNDKEHFWVGTIHTNGSFDGLILYEACPVEYCRTGKVSITLGDPNSQCDQMHAGILCGSCATNYSFMLCSSCCGKCTNNLYLALLFPFAAAGIALVVFLSTLRLTVATGMINSVILYANIVQANKDMFFPISRRNALTVFIAWLNLDLGFETCFYNGMDAYAETWLQFAFPVYVWVLISLIILTSRYSITVSRLIGDNPIAVLATLLLMSYTKVIKITIEVYSYARLDYPNNETVIVWLKDGNVLYMNPLHLLLTVVTTLIVIFLFLPYTLLLLLSYKLLRFTENRSMRWLNRLKPLLDSYYAPYKSHTRYWTGFLLLVRCGLYATFTIHSHTLTNVAIITTFAAILALCWFSGRIYNKPCVNMLEGATYLNLIILSVATLASFNSAGLVFSLLGLVFVTTVGIITYHFSRLQIVAMCVDKIPSRSALRRLPSIMRNIVTKTPVNQMPPNLKQVSSSEICLREPLLDD